MNTSHAFKFWANLHTVLTKEPAMLSVIVILPENTRSDIVENAAWLQARRLGQAFFCGKMVVVDEVNPQ